MVATRRTMIIVTIVVWALLSLIGLVKHAYADEQVAFAPPLITGNFTSTVTATTGDTATTATLFDTIMTAVVDDFLGGFTYSVGYLRSWDGDKQGAIGEASRTFINWKITKRYTLPIQGDMYVSVGHDSMLGGGVSVDLSQFVKCKAGVGYASGGYGWTWSLCPINLSF